MLEKNMDINSTIASDIMGKNPKTIDADELAVNGFQVMESNQITQLIVTSQGEYLGIVHLHDILKEGIF
jgi:arabinose-5-phosphate isomerase